MVKFCVGNRYFEVWQQVYSKLPDGSLNCMIACREEKSGRGFVAHGASLELALLNAMEDCANAKEDTFQVDDPLFNEVLAAGHRRQRGILNLDFILKHFNIRPE
jgi:hypothetical protein